MRENSRIIDEDSYMRLKAFMLAALFGAAGAATSAHAYDPMPDPRLGGSGIEDPLKSREARSERGISDRRQRDYWDSRNGVREPAFGTSENKQRARKRGY